MSPFNHPHPVCHLSVSPLMVAACVPIAPLRLELWVTNVALVLTTILTWGVPRTPWLIVPVHVPAKRAGPCSTGVADIFGAGLVLGSASTAFDFD